MNRKIRWRIILSSCTCCAVSTTVRIVKGSTIIVISWGKNFAIITLVAHAIASHSF
jgi:hypothetical protein